MQTIKTYNLFLDDERNPADAYRHTLDNKYLYEKWIVVKNDEEFVEHISLAFMDNKFPALVSFDHDLHPEHYTIGRKFRFKDFDYSLCTKKTGLHCAQWLLRFCIDHDLVFPKYLVHSQNDFGKENIERHIKTFVDKHQVKY